MSAWKRALRSGLERLGAELDFRRSRRVVLDPARLPSVCLALGPYRNLTTLTAGLLALHPECQVLNHGAARVFPVRGVDFLLDYSDERFVAFVRYAIYLSRGGRRGNFGGSITLAHAFDHDVMRETYRARYGETLVKPDVRAVFWKESMRVSNRIRENRVDLGALFRANDRIRFLMPVRNPLDCALSNQKTGHARHFHGLGEPTREAILDRVLDEIAWFLDRAAEHPGRFFHFWEDGLDAGVLADLASFLEISHDERWVRDSLACYEVKAPYEHDAPFVEHYRKSLQERLAAHPEAVERLLRFVPA